MSVELTGSSRQATSARTLLSVGAGAALLGVAMSVGQSTLVASLLTLGGLLTTLVGLHRFGRSGPDQPSRAGKKARSRRRRASSDPGPG